MSCDHVNPYAMHVGVSQARFRTLSGDSITSYSEISNEYELIRYIFTNVTCIPLNHVRNIHVHVCCPHLQQNVLIVEVFLPAAILFIIWRTRVDVTSSATSCHVRGILTGGDGDWGREPIARGGSRTLPVVRAPRKRPCWRDRGAQVSSHLNSL